MSKPILFSTPMVQAILAGRKSMTRRVINRHEPSRDKLYEMVETLNSKPFFGVGFYKDSDVFEYEGKILTDAVYYKSRYAPGDILWVRETFQKVLIEEDEPKDIYGYVYKASPETFEDYGVLRNGEECPLPWRPSIFMPKSACRIFLRVKSVRVERVQDITADDVIREGVKDVDNEIRNQDQTTHESIRNWNLAWAQYQFQTLWDSLNAKRGFGWDINPWVWVIEFERVDKPEGWPNEAAQEGGKT